MKTDFVASFDQDKEWTHNVFYCSSHCVTDSAVSYGSITLMVTVQILFSDPPLDFVSRPEDPEHLRSSLVNNLSVHHHEFKTRKVSFNDLIPEPQKKRLNNHSVLDATQSLQVHLDFEMEVNLDSTQVTVNCRQPETGKISNLLWSCFASFEFSCLTHPTFDSFTAEGWFNNVCSQIIHDIPDEKQVLKVGRNIHPIFQLRVVSKQVYPVSTGDPTLEATVPSDFASLFLDESLADFFFHVGRHRVPSHKLVLCDRCEFFRQEMTADFDNNNKRNYKKLSDWYSMEIPMIEIRPFLSFLRFLYCNEVTVEDTDSSLAQILSVADKLNHETAVRAMFPLLSPNNALIFLQFRYHLPNTFIERLWKVIDSCAVAIMSSRYFLSLTAQEIIEIINRDTFYAPELVIYHSCLNWSEDECIRNKKELDIENKRFYLKEILKHIRFSLFSRTDFLMEPSIPFMLSEAERRNVLRRINAKDEKEPLGLERFVSRPRIMTRLF